MPAEEPQPSEAAPAEAEPEETPAAAPKQPAKRSRRAATAKANTSAMAENEQAPKEAMTTTKVCVCHRTLNSLIARGMPTEMTAKATVNAAAETEQVPRRQWLQPRCSTKTSLHTGTATTRKGRGLLVLDQRPVPRCVIVIRIMPLTRTVQMLPQAGAATIQFVRPCF